MESWHYLNLGDAMLAGEALEKIKASFAAEYADGRGANETGLFVRHESEGRLHCEVVVYFPPPAASLARRLGAIPCGQPSAPDLGLLTGSEGGS
jgi:hypothetical protein